MKSNFFFEDGTGKVNTDIKGIILPDHRILTTQLGIKFYPQVFVRLYTQSFYPQ